MSTIDDLACAKLAAAGCPSPKAIIRELKLFGFPEKDLSQYLRAKAWELEEAVALGLGRHPRNLSISVIREKCPEQIDLQGKARPDEELPTAQLFMDRYELLKRAAFIGDLKSEERGGTLWFKPVDLATYARKEWDYMPDAARALMDAAAAPATATEPAAAPFVSPSANTAADGAVGPQECLSYSVSEPAPAAEPDTEGKEVLSSPGVLKAEMGKAARKAACKAWLIETIRAHPGAPPEWLINAIRTYTDKPPLTQPALREFCMNKFSIGWHDFEDAWRAAKKETRCAWYERGKRPKTPFILAS